tara:strand:+ start:14303 stop:15247 length:945 start_codon:yes stop_codon:yes gene_type:complete
LKLIIQIPCYNEAKILPETLETLPKNIEGFDIVEWLIVDDGSQDNTSDVAKAYGVDYIVKLPNNQGLAKSFMIGLEASLQNQADVIVNLDADNQYYSGDIIKLTNPILEGKADITIGERPISEITQFSAIKKFLQRIGSLVVRQISGTNVIDAPSGFRAISKNAALQINIFNDYTYTLEMIIQAGVKNMAILSIPIKINQVNKRPSRLIKSMPDYIIKSIFTITKIFMVYNPFKFFFSIGTLFFIPGFLLGLRWLVLFFIFEHTRTHIPSLILASILFTLGLSFYIVGALSNVSAINRKILEDIQLRLKKMELN